MESVVIRPVDLSFLPERTQLEAFLHSHHLKLEKDVEQAFGLYDAGEELLGCGCASGNILKCFAIDESLRGQNGLGTLVSHLTADRFAAGHDHLFVVTRPRNLQLFSGCGFYPVARTTEALVLENRRRGPEKFLSRLPKAPEGVEDIGAIVMNCNPFTLGHQALIRRAAAECAFLYVFVVEEDKSQFPFADRIDLVRKGTAELENVCVCPSGPYMISAMTFPTYFLKETEDPSAIQSALDVTVFASRIAPGLGIKKRFAGTEPLDAVTNGYNRAMEKLLPEFGLEFRELPRVCAGEEPISASRVRKLLEEKGGVTEEIRSLVPTETAAYLLDRFGEGRT